MIKYKQLKWSDAFSYGKDNVLNLDENPLTQLLGKNGNGKSSIALIIEEVLYNTNSKKIKKSDILNRFTKSKNYTISLSFEKDGVPYEILTTRTVSSGTVKLYCGGEDISAHTATNTYKLIEQIIGYDHKMFSQIVYQSSVSSLEFLTATDTARKKFLIELLNLTAYTEASDEFKELASEKTRELATVNTRIATISDWLERFNERDLVAKELQVEPEEDPKLDAKLQELNLSLGNIEFLNKNIIQNNTYIKILRGIVLVDRPLDLPEPSYHVDLQAKIQNANRRLAEGKSLSGTTATTTCKTCTQTIDNTTRYTMFTKFLAEKEDLVNCVKQWETMAQEYLANVKAMQAYNTCIEQFEKYTNLIDESVPDTVLDSISISTEIASLTKTIATTKQEIAKVRAANKLVDAHNAKVSVLLDQFDTMNSDKAVAVTEALVLSKELATLQVLVKAFSPTGLIAYKIECLVKDLEAITNEYLGVLADGRFQLSFKIASSDKLNVVITDNGCDIDILALSTGERARVNVSTLLGIRKLMQAISNSRTNLLILDETVESLDVEGKEKLIEVLLAEESLNTFLISHGFSHPLLEKINIVKDNNVSRIEN
jgi:DNA repair exonuclease SbcCD ATPase subunit